MKHFILSFRHLMLVAIMFFSITASAYDFEVDGICYNVVSISDLTCEVTYKSLNKADSYVGDVVIPKVVSYKNKSFSVTSIGKEAFSNCSGLTSITIPNSVTSIRPVAFRWCSNLTKLVIEDGESALELSFNQTAYTGEGQFYDCPIETLYIGRNLSYEGKQSDGYSPFAYNKSIKDITIAHSVTSLGEYAFYECTGLTNITIPNSVISIGNYAFSGCTGVKSIVFEDGEKILKIGYNGDEPGLKTRSLFNDCPIEKLYIGRNLSCEQAGLFENQKRLKDVTLSNNVTSITHMEFEYCTALTNFTIPSSVTSMGGYAFAGCTSLTSVTIPNSVTSLGEKAFAWSSSLMSITIPNTVASIEEETFQNCSGLTTITIGNSVSSIKDDAFEGCSALTSITSLNPTPPTVGKGNFTNKQFMDMVVYVPREAVSAYQSADTWKNFWDIQGIDVTGIQSIETTKQTPTAIYDLQGRKLTKPKKGINIIGGKKILVK